MAVAGAAHELSGMTLADHPAPAAVSPEFVALQRVVLGRYSLERELGRGGMGVVFLARDVALDRPVAIKLLPPALAASAAARERFLREARAVARLSHPHIVPVHAVEAHDGPDALAFFVMGYVDGETLGARVRRAGPLPAAEAMRVVQEVSWALGHAHANGVIHRDVKPDNILLERDTGRAVVADFGIAQRTDLQATPATGLAVGTPQYMSPEQAAGEPVDARSDLYALGVTAFYAATGRLPFEGRTAVALLAQHAATPAPSLLSLRPSLPPRFAAAVDRCLAKDVADRFASAEELATAVRDARGAVPETPAPVRTFLREADQAGTEIGTALTATIVALVVLALARAVGGALDDIFSTVIYASMAVFGVGLAGVRLGQLLEAARGLLRRGYDHRALAPALAAAERERESEREAESLVAAHAGRSEARERWTLAAIGAVKSGLAFWIANSGGSDLVDRLGVLGNVVVLLGIAGSVAIPTATVRLLWRGWEPGRRLWNRALGGRAGRLMFRIAAIGVSGARESRPAAGEPTVAVLGRAAEELFDALPAAQRAPLGDVPALVARLQADAAWLRGRPDDPAAAERLRMTVGALEAMRLDLLRLHAGTGSLDELTRDVEAARDLGRRVDAMLEARALAEPRGHTPPGPASTPI